MISRITPGCEIILEKCRKYPDKGLNWSKMENMKRIFPHLALLLMLGIACAHCTPTPTDSAQQISQSPTDERSEKPQHHTPACVTQGKQLSENGAVWIRPLHIWVAITADSSTLDPAYGESYRIAEVYDTRSCTLVSRKVFPVNGSPDFPYFSAEISYHNTHQMVAVRGAYSLFLFDAVNRRWLPELKPAFSTQRQEVDDQSGTILRLEVWEDYLLGFCRDFGAFAFDLKDKARPKSVKPYAEYKASTTDFRGLFLLSAGANTYQAILPHYEKETGKFAVQPMLDKPMALPADVVTSGAGTSRYLVLRDASVPSHTAVIDFLQQQRLSIPAKVAEQSEQEILSWISRNNNQ